MLLNISLSLFHPEFWQGCGAHQYCSPPAPRRTRAPGHTLPCQPTAGVGRAGGCTAVPEPPGTARGCEAHSSITIPTRFLLESLTAKRPFVLRNWRFSGINSSQISPQNAPEYTHTALILVGGTKQAELCLPSPRALSVGAPPFSHGYLSHRVLRGTSLCRSKANRSLPIREADALITFASN